MTTNANMTPDLPPNLLRLLQGLGSDYVIITPNQRLSRYLHAAWGEYQLSLQNSAWPALNCLPRSAWFKQLWQSIQLNHLHERAHWPCLNTLQSHALWRQIIASDSDGWELLSLSQVEKFAIDGWQSLRLWQVPLARLKRDYAHLEETQQFHKWIQAYQYLCTSKELLDDIDKQEIILELCTINKLTFAKRIFLYGFENHEPLFDALLAALRVQDIDVIIVDEFSQQAGVAKQHVAPTIETEMQHAARWAAAILEKQATAKVAVVVPELSLLHTKIERIFNEVFNPQCNQPGYTRHAPSFNISAAQNLAHTPPIAAALAALQLNRHRLEHVQIAAIFRSVFIGDTLSERARERLLARWQSEYPSMRQSQIRAELAHAAEQDHTLAHFYRQLSSFFDCARNKHSARLNAAAWLDIFVAQLHALGWPGERVADTLEFQQLSKWQAILDEFMSLASLGEMLGVNEALDFFSRAAQQTFHAQTEDSPIQVLGLLEAAGLQFDYLWVAQMDEQTWPPKASPNPLIPQSLQQQLKMPRASSEGELHYAQNLTQRLVKAAKHVIFSYAKQGKNEDLQASPLIKAYPPLAHIDLVDVYQPTSLTLELLRTDSVTPLSSTKASGGTHILKDYAACPFRAFARYRLHAENAETFEEGIKARARGNLLHQSLDNLWCRLKDQHTLLALTEEQLEQYVTQAVEAAWSRVFSTQEIASKLRELEIQRSVAVLLAWLRLEKQRSNFSVLEREGTHDMSVGAMHIKMRYDRIDKLDNNSVVVIDYKSGTNSIGDWAGDRPNEPQVPLYALANRDKVSAAAFGLVSAKKTAFEGVSIDKATAPGLKEPTDRFQRSLPQSWADILQNWEQVLVALGNRWVAGEVPVDPKDRRQTCKYCDLHSLCRIKSAYTEEQPENDVESPD